MLLYEQHNDVYDFLNYIIDDTSGHIGEKFMNFQGPVSKLLAKDPHAMFMYNLFVKTFNKNKKYYKKEGLEFYQYLNFPTVTENIAIMRPKDNTENAHIFAFCVCLWLHLHH